jgi:hypothetical protein
MSFFTGIIYTGLLPMEANLTVEEGIHPYK